MQGPTSQEYEQLRTAAASLGKAGSDLQEQLGKCKCCLVMDFIPGMPLFDATEPFQQDNLKQTASDLGRYISGLIFLEHIISPDSLKHSIWNFLFSSGLVRVMNTFLLICAVSRWPCLESEASI